LGIPGGFGGVTERIVGAIVIAVITLTTIVAIIVFLVHAIAPTFIGLFRIALIIGAGILIYTKLKVKEKEKEK
jgi:hypothetical protein